MTEFPRTAGGAPVVFLETTGSTNAEALARAAAGERGPLWIAAKQQSAGRGRRGRAWASEPGNLYATLLLSDAAPAAALPGICFVAALAVHDALLDATHGLAPAQLKLKWPNDILLDGRKVVGILVEGVSGAAHAAAIGIGVNCKHHPQSTEFPATDLANAGFVVPAEMLLRFVGAAMERRLGEWQRGENFSAVRAAWLARASGLGAPIEVRLPNRTMSGTFEALDERGALVLRYGNGTCETVAAGDVFPLVAR
jgi:BirA family transcriptional regulator, biotin operon repressor / biotin---[acetyl-CoA-carboxylase] ligase